MLQEIKNSLSPDLKTLIIINSKFHNLLSQQLLEDNQVLFDVSLLSINSFMQTTLSDNKLNTLEENSLLNQLVIYQKLTNANHHYQNNLNFISELAKLEREYLSSNLTCSDDYANFITTTTYDFSDLTIPHDQIIILSEHDFYPIHQEFIKAIETKTKVIRLELIKPKQTKYYEHPNTIKMLDYIVAKVYESPEQETFIFCDDLILQDYLTNSFNELGLAFYQLEQTKTITHNQLVSLASVLINKYSEVDLVNLSNLTKLTAKQIYTLRDLPYQSYLKKLYNILYQTKLFEPSYLNNIFSKIYLLDTLKDEVEPSSNIDNDIITTLLFNELSNNLVKPIFKQTKIMIGSQLPEIKFDRIIIVDATLPNFKAKSVSFLLNNEQRSKINPKLINNSFYNSLHKLKQQLLLNSGITVDVHYSLLSLDNKPQDLAYFIKEAAGDNYQIENIEQYYHLSTIEPKINQLLLNNEVVNLDKNKLARVYQQRISLSATQLDTFYNCPYKYFVSYLLKPRQINNELNSLLLGNIFHKIIELINQEIISLKGDYNSLDLKQLNTIITSGFDECLSTENLIELIPTYKLNYVRAKVTSTIINFITGAQHQDLLSTFKLKASELNLSYSYNNSYFNDVLINGKIDALYEYHNYHYVLDYKSSAKKFSKSDFSVGIANQLIVYLALLQNNDYSAIGAFFKTFKDDYLKAEHILDYNTIQEDHLNKNKLTGLLFESEAINDFDSSLISEKKSVLSDLSLKNIYPIDELQTLLAQLNQHFDGVLKAIDLASFPIYPYEEKSCKYCNYQAICKVALPNYRKEANHE